MLDPTLLRRFIAVSMFAMFGFAPSAHAADNSPSVRAARLTLVQGAVSVSAVNQAATAAQVNQPLLTGAMLSTGGDGQAEVEFEDGSVVRLTPNSALSLDNLAVDPGGIFTSNLSLLHGLAYLELRATPEYQYFLNAGGDVLSPVENTTVRVNFDEPPAIFAVLDGTAHVEGLPGPEGTPNNGGFEADLRAGESLRGDATSSSRYFLTQEIAQDTWDQWNRRLQLRHPPTRAFATTMLASRVTAGRIWTPREAGTTCPDRGRCGSLMLPVTTRASTRTAMARGCGRAGGIYGRRAIRGAGLHTAAGTGRTTTDSAGDGHRERDAAAWAGDSPAEGAIR